MKLLTFSIIALFITLPWFLHPGFLLLLDWSGIPNPQIALDATGGIAGMPIQILWVIASKITSPEFAQKLLIFLMLVLAGTTTYQLAQFLTKKSIASLCAGIFMMTNAFVFNRLQMGHIYLLYAYALTPLALYLTLTFLEKPTTKRAAFAGITNSGVILLSIHHIILLPIITALFAWHTWKKQYLAPKHYILFLGPYVVIMAIIIAILYSYPSSTLHKLSQQDLAVFAPRPQCTRSVVLDTLLLSAQWRDPSSAPLPCLNKKLFYIANSILAILMLIGAWKHKKLFFGAIILVLAADISFIPAMRDSAKYIADLALVEATLLAYGIAYSYKKTNITLFPILALGIAILASTPMYWGLSHTITPRQYPQSWHAFNSQLAELSQKPTILFLPWHLYMPFNFTNGQTIANPAILFFTNANVVQGDNLEIRQGNRFISTQSSSPISKTIDDVLAMRTTPDFASQFNMLLAHQHISYIALAHGSPEEAEYQILLASLPYLHKTLNSAGLTVWQFGE